MTDQEVIKKMCLIHRYIPKSFFTFLYSKLNLSGRQKEDTFEKFYSMILAYSRTEYFGKVITRYMDLYMIWSKTLEGRTFWSDYYYCFLGCCDFKLTDENTFIKKRLQFFLSQCNKYHLFKKYTPFMFGQVYNREPQKLLLEI